MARINFTHHRKFRRLTRALGSPALALGTLELLWLAAYEAADPVVGGEIDIADATGWAGDPADLVALLQGCRLLDAVAPDLYAVHDLWDHAPDYVRKRWIRAHPAVAEDARPWRRGGQTPPAGEQTSPAGDQMPPYPSRPVPSRPSTERQRAGARDPDPVNPRVLTRLAYDLPDDLDDEADKKDELKTLATRYRLEYDATAIATALDAVARTRKRPAWVRDPYYGKRPAARRRRRRFA
jgi:hypothetical protein